MTEVFANPIQLPLIEMPVAPSAIEAVEMLSNAGAEQRGAIYTKREVVDFILDLVGYTSDKELYRHNVLEPSFGNGDFLQPMVERLIESFRSATKDEPAVSDLKLAIRGVELHRGTFVETRKNISRLLVEAGFSETNAEELVSQWLSQGDFLLKPIADDFDFIVGNPPYVRQELIPEALIAEYRRRFQTVFDRADIYIPFIEKSLSLLKRNGILGFICSDRWMKNRYGGPLRRLVAERFNLKFHVDMVDTPAFHSDVIAYPAVTVIENKPAGVSRLVRRPKIDAKSLKALACGLHSIEPGNDQIVEVSDVTKGNEPWILESWDRLAVVRRLENNFPTIEEAGCNVGIGVATGADKVFIAPFDDLDIEPDRKLRLVMTRDILTGEVKWRGFGVINPFKDGGGVVSLSEYPRLAKYLNRHGEEIKRRHVSKRNPDGWFRTIDRIYPELAQREKLLIPDIKGAASVVYEAGVYYPHHNLYYITSEEWNLKALQVVLKSGIARLFVSTYSTKMHGGFLRYQAQYLRRIRIPRWRDVKTHLQSALIEAAERDDPEKCDELVVALYNFSSTERTALARVVEL